MRKKIVVVGGGLAGSLLCNKLSGQFDVTLLEIGSKDSLSYPEITIHNKKLAQVPTICYGGGGTTNLWHNGLIPIRAEDVDSASPFHSVLQQAEAYTDDVSADLFFKDGQYTSEYTTLTRRFSDQAKEKNIFPEGVDCLLYPDKYKALEVNDQVDAYYNVDQIRFRAQDKTITGVTFTCGAESKTLDVDQVVISAGALGSPKVVGEVLKAVDHPFDPLGTGFIDHPMGFVGKVRFKKEHCDYMRDLSALDRGDFVSRNAVRVTSDCGNYTCGIFLRPALTMDNRLDIYKYKSALGASSGLRQIKTAFSTKIFHPDIIAEIVSHLFGVNLSSRVYNVLLIADQKRGSNRVFFNEKGLNVDWGVSDEEIAVYRSILKKFIGYLGDAAEEVNVNTELDADWLWSAAHHSCTIPMGDGPEDLIDQDLKLHCCENAFVCDGSVIQEHSYANTGLAIGQLAYRLADRISNG